MINRIKNLYISANNTYENYLDLWPIKLHILVSLKLLKNLKIRFCIFVLICYKGSVWCLRILLINVTNEASTDIAMCTNLYIQDIYKSCIP